MKYMTVNIPNYIIDFCPRLMSADGHEVYDELLRELSGLGDNVDESVSDWLNDNHEALERSRNEYRTIKFTIGDGHRYYIINKYNEYLGVNYEWFTPVDKFYTSKGKANKYTSYDIDKIKLKEDWRIIQGGKFSIISKSPLLKVA